MTEQDQQDAAHAPGTSGAALPAPRGPVPDLGFFAGAPQPHGNGGLGGPAATPFGSPAATPFGGPAATPFGSPAPAVPGPQGPPPGNPVAAQGPIATLRSTAGGRFVFRIGVGLAVSLVLGVLGVGRFAGLGLFGSPGITTPATLGGEAPSSSSAARSVVEAKTAAAAAYGGELVVEVYGGDSAPIVFVGATGDGVLEDADVTTAVTAVGGAGAHRVNDSVCAAYGGGVGQLCARVGEGRLVMVASVARSAEETAALTDEAWAAQ